LRARKREAIQFFSCAAWIASSQKTLLAMTASMPLKRHISTIYPAIVGESNVSIQCIVGLGNPGAEYEKTRHNAGAWFVLDLAKKFHATLKHESKFKGFHAIAKIHDHECHLLIPTTFMNLSGQSVKALANFYKISPENILVAHDEIDVPAGDSRLKFDGGHGGHNGLRDIIDHFGTNKFHRLRIGVGHPGDSKLVHDYVLHAPKKNEREEIDFAIAAAEKVMPLVLSGEFQKAMNELHTKKE
jgi:PTH1 family peptidyl-tRNA hydrolase